MRYTLSEERLVKEVYLKNQARRLSYLKEHISISINDTWYDVGRTDSKNILREYLENHYGKNVIAYDGDLNYKTTFPDSFADVITHLEVIEHLLNPLLNLKECYRILRPAGRLYLTTPNDYSLILKLEHLLSRKLESHFHQFNEYELKWLLTVAQFRQFTIKKFKKTQRGYVARFCNNSFFVEAIK